MATVLIVEDDPMNRRVFKTILKKRGKLEVQETEEVEKVIELARSGKVDVILMDVSLSNSFYQGQAVDGIKITQILKRDPITSKLPIIIVTAHAMAGDRETFLEQSGADEYISKPIIDHQEFVDQIKAMIS